MGVAPRVVERVPFGATSRLAAEDQLPRVGHLVQQGFSSWCSSVPLFASDASTVALFLRFGPFPSRRSRTFPTRIIPTRKQQRRQVGERDEPVAGVGEDDHPFAAESSQRPRQVKHTIRTSMTICERVAACGVAVERERAVVARARARRTWPTTSAPTWTYQMPVARDDAVVDRRVRAAEQVASRRRAGRRPAATGPGRCRRAARSSGRRGRRRRSGSACARSARAELAARRSGAAGGHARASPSAQISADDRDRARQPDARTPSSSARADAKPERRGRSPAGAGASVVEQRRPPWRRRTRSMPIDDDQQRDRARRPGRAAPRRRPAGAA